MSGVLAGFFIVWSMIGVGWVVGRTGVLGAHDLRTRISGTHWFVQLHLELPGELSLSKAHHLCDEAVLAIHKEFPRAEVLVHADPQEVVGKETIS